MRYLLIVVVLLYLMSDSNAQVPGKFKGQSAIRGVSTTNKPVNKQWKGVFSFPESKVFFSNDFPGARLNGVTSVGDSLFILLITSENTPINQSPWYAFKVWSEAYKEITLRLTYQQNSQHRYMPKMSKNGKDWDEIQLNSGKYDSVSKTYEFVIETGKDTSWVAAQELYTTTELNDWIDRLSLHKDVSVGSLGNSFQGRRIPVLKIGNSKSENSVMVIGRQHPPEVTGQIAEVVFIENILSNEEWAKKFREKFVIYLIPIVNPDGVDDGFWRHNTGGIDLNRDWYEFNQPETRAIRNFLKREITDNRKKLWFAIDFHSTFDDIFYIVDNNLKGLMPGFVQQWLNAIKNKIEGYEPNIKPLYNGGPTYTFFSYVFKTYGTEALVYEIGDKTSRDFIIKKSQTAAETLGNLLLEKVK